MIKGVNTAIIPVAGLGTRWLPFTKAVPKEFLPIGTRPAIDYVVREAVDSGIKKIIFVISPGRNEIRKYFQKRRDLELLLNTKGKNGLLKALHTADFKVDFRYVRQESPTGLGAAVSKALRIVGNDSFALMLPDEVLDSKTGPFLAKMIALSLETKKSVLAVKHVPVSDIARYGIVKPCAVVNNRFFLVDYAVEKPKPKLAPSNLAIIGRYVFYGEDSKRLLKNNGDLALALNSLAQKKALVGIVFKGKRYDVGKFEDFLRANNEMGERNAAWNK